MQKSKILKRFRTKRLLLENRGLLRDRDRCEADTKTCEARAARVPVPYNNLMRIEAGFPRASLSREGRRRSASAAVAVAARGGWGRFFEALDGDAAGDGQREEGEGEQLAHVVGLRRGRFQQPLPWHAEAGVSFSKLTKATPPARASSAIWRPAASCARARAAKTRKSR